MSLQSIRRIFMPIAVCHFQAQKAIALRSYARWMKRNPSKVTLPFEIQLEPKSKVSLKKETIITLDTKSRRDVGDNKVEVPDKKCKNEDEMTQNVKVEKKISPQKSKEIKENRDEATKKRKFYLSQKKVFDDNNQFIYEKLKDNDGRTSTLLVKLKNKKDRVKSGQVLVEGWRLIVDGLEAKCPLLYIFFSRLEDLNNLRPFLPKTGVQIYKISYKEMELWSDVDTPSGIFGVFEMPKPQNVRIISKPLPLHLICDNIRIPGNLGAILRTAVGVGCEKVLLTKGCVDIWDPKVIRSAAGAHFRLPIYNSIQWEDISEKLETGTSIFVADSNARINEDNSVDDKYDTLQIPVMPYYSVDYASLQHITLVIGGETEGISEESYRLAVNNNGVRLNIPLQKGVDSLNTGMAAAVITFEIRKQLLQLFTKDMKICTQQAT